MGWIQELYETYENSKELVGLVDETGNVLLPIGHSTQNAQVEVAINLDGEFQEAGKIEDKGRAVTIIPVTEDSGTRSSGIAPVSYTHLDVYKRQVRDYDDLRIPVLQTVTGA